MQIGIIGAGSCDAATAGKAEKVGRLIAERGAVLVCGGMGGVMEAAARGAREGGGIAVGVLPTADPDEGNPYLTVRIATGFGQGRNVLIPRSCHGVIAVAGGYGTLSEIALTRKLGVPLVGIDTWDPDGSFPVVSEPEEAVKLLWKQMGE
ncbi:MAG: TIGR00725 family protein [Candidatus Eisenbacteria bacterium]|nr:TIGR00725 family protein [Candidatus Eisenbacteria bacterium]